MNSRLAWVDIAKAGAILLVVVYHVGSTGMSHLTVGGNVVETLWVQFNTALLPVRMPLFFLVAGILARGAVRRPWAALWRRRIADLLWPFALWSLAFAPAYALAYASSGRREVAWEAASWTLVGGGAYWFLPALVAFVVVARLMRSIPLVFLVAAFLLRLAAPHLRVMVDDGLDPDLVMTLYRWGTFMVWFAAGVAAAPVIERIAALPWGVPLAGTVAYAALAVLVYRDGWTLVPALNILGIVIAVSASGALARSARIAAGARYLAARTLPIYLMHPLLLAVIVAGVGGLAPSSPVLSAVAVPVLVAGLTAVSTLVYDALRNRAGWLFRLPGGRGTAVRSPADEAVER